MLYFWKFACVNFKLLVTVMYTDRFLWNGSLIWFCVPGVMSQFIFIMTSSNRKKYALLAFCAGNSPATGEFPLQRPVTIRRWFETPSRSLWRHYNVLRHRVLLSRFSRNDLLNNKRDPAKYKSVGMDTSGVSKDIQANGWARKSSLLNDHKYQWTEN